MPALAHRFRNNYTKSASCVIGIVIYETMYLGIIVRYFLSQAFYCFLYYSKTISNVHIRKKLPQNISLSNQKTSIKIPETMILFKKFVYYQAVCYPAKHFLNTLCTGD